MNSGRLENGRTGIDTSRKMKLRWNKSFQTGTVKDLNLTKSREKNTNVYY